MKTVIKAIFSVLFSYIFLLYMKIPINGMIIIGVGIAFYKIWMTKKDFDRIDDKLSYIAFSLLLSISIVLSKHIHPDECNPFATIDKVFIDKFSIVDLIGCLICLFVIVNILNWLIKKIQKLKFNKGELANAKKELKKKNQFMIFGLIFLSWMPYFLIYYPGLIYGDSMGSIYQTVYHLNLSNHHPVFYTIFIAICLKIGYIFSDINAGCAIYTLIQMLYISGLLTYIVSWMYNKGISKILCCFTVIFFAGTATFPQHAISMWKDPIFSITLVYYSLKLYDYIISDGKIEEKERLYWVKLTISMLIISLTRNNGIYILMLSFLSLVILTIKNIKLSKKIYFTHILSIVFIILLTGPGYDILGIQKDKVESYGIPLQQVARVIAYDGNINNVEEEFVNDIIPVEKLKTVYTPQLVDSIKWNEDFNDNFFENHKKEFLKVWFSLFKKNPRIYLESWCLSTYGYWSLNTWSLNYFQANISQGNLEYIKDNDNCGVYNTNLLENPKIDLKKAFSLFTPTPSIAICIWIALFMLFYMWVNKRRKYIILLIPVLGNWLTLLIATPIAYWPRYALSILYMFPVILSIPMLCLYGKEKQDNSDNFSFVNSEK